MDVGLASRPVASRPAVQYAYLASATSPALTKLINVLKTDAAAGETDGQAVYMPDAAKLASRYADIRLLLQPQTAADGASSYDILAWCLIRNVHDVKAHSEARFSAPSGVRIAVLEWLQVLPAHRGSGLGRLLLEEVQRDLCADALWPAALPATALDFFRSTILNKPAFAAWFCLFAPVSVSVAATGSAEEAGAGAGAGAGAAATTKAFFPYTFDASKDFAGACSSFLAGGPAAASAGSWDVSRLMRQYALWLHSGDTSRTSASGGSGVVQDVTALAAGLGLGWEEEIAMAEALLTVTELLGNEDGEDGEDGEEEEEGEGEGDEDGEEEGEGEGGEGEQHAAVSRAGARLAGHRRTAAEAGLPDRQDVEGVGNGGGAETDGETRHKRVRLVDAHTQTTPGTTKARNHEDAPAAAAAVGWPGSSATAAATAGASADAACAPVASHSAAASSPNVDRTSADYVWSNMQW